MRLPRRAHRVRVPGFRFAGVRCGLKLRGRDVALIVSSPPAVAAGVFTTNQAPAAPVQVARRRVRAGRAAAVLVHAGNANACTGRQGLETVTVSTALAAQLTGVQPEWVLPCATGRIGMQVPRARLLRGVRDAVAALGAGGFADAANAITTTDAFPKTAVRRLRLGRRKITLAALGKGAGMIAPNMATLIVCVVSDARLTAAAAQTALRDAVEGTFNGISVDGDMSTNDTVLLLANGAANNPTIGLGSRDHGRFTEALRSALDEIAQLIVLDGEGATKLVEIAVRGAPSAEAAIRVARAIGESTLCKTAFHGADPNWGRFVCAAGTAGVRFDADQVDVRIGGVVVSRRGRPIQRALAAARARMREREFRIELDLRQGRSSGRFRASDLSVEYVRFNAEYTT